MTTMSSYTIPQHYSVEAWKYVALHAFVSNQYVFLEGLSEIAQQRILSFTI